MERPVATEPGRVAGAVADEEDLPARDRLPWKNGGARELPPRLLRGSPTRLGPTGRGPVCGTARAKEVLLSEVR